MLTVDDYGAIRRAHRDGMPIKRIALEFEHSRNTIRKILKHPEPNPIPRERNRTAAVLGLFQSIIDQILLDDEEAPPKQRHTAMQVFRRLQDEHGYHGCYGQVQRYVHTHRRRHRETLSLWGTCQANASRPILATSTAISPMAGGRFLSWSRPGPTRMLPSFWLSPSSAQRRS